jgi:hypothetical protein
LFDGSEGIVREPAIDYDATTVYFAYRPDKPLVDGWDSYWHMYAMGADGSGLRKLTDGPFHDFDSVVPARRRAWPSTPPAARSASSAGGRRLTCCIAWTADGTNIPAVARQSQRMEAFGHAGRPHPLDSLRVLGQGCRFRPYPLGHPPDGTHPELVFGNNTPNCYSQAHEVPGTGEIVCTLMSHGDHQGPIALIDRSKAPFDTRAITNITPTRGRITR